ncbi:MAG TPA: hypothetical protein VGV38_13025 [Pyrinomonadaceae bacterium]|nr:hypothetical protein [Pyrinomonadaceae bacterium]
MLRINRNQLEVFEGAAEARFAARLVGYLREHHAEAVAGLDDDTLKARALLGVRRARSYGLTWDSKVAAFVALMFEISPSFDRHPRIREGLTDRNVAPNYRLDILLNRTSDQDWMEAGLLGDQWPAH